MTRKPSSFRPRLEALEDRCLLSTLTVTNTLDSGKGSLRAEIAAVKSNKDVIVFAPGLSGQTIQLTSGELDITKSLTIQGPGAGNLTINGIGGGDMGAGDCRVFEVAAGTNVALSGLTISGGESSGITGAHFDGYGGGILNLGALTVSGCSLSGNEAVSAGGGIANLKGGTLTVSGCSLSGNTAVYPYGDYGGVGGGIYNEGSLTVSGNSTLSNNGAGQGGGVYNVGTATISNSTLSGNYLSYLTNPYEGGAIYNAGTLTVSGCTVTNNDAVGVGGFPAEPSYGGGIYNAGTLTVSDSIFSNNSPDNIFGPYTDLGGNTFS